MSNFKVKSRFTSFLAFIVLAVYHFSCSSAAASVFSLDKHWTRKSYGCELRLMELISLMITITLVYMTDKAGIQHCSCSYRDIAYNWLYSGLHAWFQASAKISVFVIHNGATNTMMVYDSAVSGNFNATGTSTLHLTAGDTYGFIIYGKNYDSNSFLMEPWKSVKPRLYIPLWQGPLRMAGINRMLRWIGPLGRVSQGYLFGL